MRIESYYRNVLVPGNAAVSALRRAGMPINRDRIHRLRGIWTKELRELESFVEGEALKNGVVLKYSDKHAVSPDDLARFLYGKPGLGLECKGRTPTGGQSTADEDLAWYASLSVPRETDHPVVKAILQIRSLAKGLSTYLNGFERAIRPDGCLHPQYNWTLRTARISAENPNVHAIPERADKRVANAIKSCFVPRVKPCLVPEMWNPRIHGSCFRWDISGAEACWRAAALTAKFCKQPDPIAWEYLRFGKDIHSKTASLIYNVPEGTFKKGSYERDAVGKQTFFAKQYGAKAFTVQANIWKTARKWLDDEEAQRISDNFDASYPGLVELYYIDQDNLGRLGYCEDGYGRRRKIPIPQGVRYLGDLAWDIDGFRWTPNDPKPRGDDYRRRLISELEHAFHIAANSPTQSMNASDTFWMLALALFGEYVELQVPPMWEATGPLYPEVSEWRFHGGPGPGGKPFQAWHCNTVHDSGWGDCAPGYLEPTAKVLWRRCRALPMDWRIETDVPYRIDLNVGPDMSTLMPYDQVAKKFGLEPLARYTIGDTA